MSFDRDPAWDYVVESSEDLAKVEHVALTGPTDKDLHEQLVALRLLTVAAAQHLLAFPLCVKHTAKTSIRPDFKLLSRNCRIALECAKIMTTNLGHAEAIQFRGATDLPLRRSSLLDPQERRLSKQELINQAFIIPQEVFPPTLATVDQHWLELFDQTVRRKLEILAFPDFPHGDADWLALWDRTGSQRWQMQSRMTDEPAWHEFGSGLTLSGTYLFSLRIFRGLQRCHIKRLTFPATDSTA